MGKLKDYLLEQFELGYGVCPETFEPYPLNQTNVQEKEEPQDNKESNQNES